MRLSHHRLVFLSLCALVMLPSRPAGAWGLKVHVAISLEAAKAVPDEMKEWRNYADILARNSMNPDFWKENDRKESPRHYMDMDNYVGLPLADIPRGLEEATAKWGPRRMAQEGIAPWIMVELQEKLTQAMSGNRWEDATRLAAAMSHYIGDTHQPLHCTRLFDGPNEQSRGLHLRWEENMPGFFWRFSMVKASPVVLIDDPWTAVWQWTKTAYAQCDSIFKADAEARSQSHGDIESAVYYQSLWTQTKPLFIAQTSQAATDLASFWYTAWVRAGRPPIPAPPATVDNGSIWPQDQAPPRKQSSSAWPFLAVLTVSATVIILLGMRKRVN